MKKLFAVLFMFLISTRAGDKGWKLPSETAKLERGPGVEAALGQCLICHSADYISIQPPMTRAAWAATVTKMKEKYGAPLQPDYTNAIVNYLAKTYGTEKPTSEKK
jgi:sulfite dehydrogenase